MMEETFLKALATFQEKTVIVLMGDEEERRYLSRRVLLLLQERFPEKELAEYRSGDDDLMQSLAQPSLFTRERIIHISDVQNLKTIPQTDDILLLSGSSLKSIPKKALLFDLSKEKPWDREKRLMRWLAHYVAREKKSVEAALLDRLVKSERSFLSMLQELDKLLMLTADKPTITLSDYQTFEQEKSSVKGWALSENVAFGLGVSRARIDPQEFFSLLGQVRYHLQTALLVAQAKPEDQPRLHPKALKKYQEQATRLHAPYFEKALQHLFDIEHMAKTKGAAPHLLWDLLSAKLMQLSRL